MGSAEVGVNLKQPECDIRAQVERIVTSGAFSGSERLCRFLTWTVDKVLAGQFQDIKQYAIGVEVFDRGSDFDPRIDSIVRTEAQRLRRKLSEYYDSEGASDPIVISFAPGTYVPTVQLLQSEATAGTHQFSITVLPFMNLSAEPAQDAFGYALAATIAEYLTNSGTLKVISPFPAWEWKVDDDAARMGPFERVDIVVKGGVQQGEDRTRVHVRAIHARSGRVIWARSFDHEAVSDRLVLQDEFACEITDELIRIERLTQDSCGSQPRSLPASSVASK
jgi:serine/threonine-protein kinase